MWWKFSLLNISTGLFLIWCAFYTIFNYGQLSEGEGWGIVAMVGLAGVGAVLLVIDLIIQAIFKDKRMVNITGLIVVLVAAFLLLLT